MRLWGAYRGPDDGAHAVNNLDFIRSISHHAASEFAKLGLAAPDVPLTATATIEDAGVRVIVTIVKHERAVLHYDEETRCSFIGPPVEPDSIIAGLSALQRRVLNVLDVEHRRKGTWIAAKVKSQYCGSFRAALSMLKKMGLIANEGGYYRTSKTSGTL